MPHLANNLSSFQVDHARLGSRSDGLVVCAASFPALSAAEHIAAVAVVPTPPSWIPRLSVPRDVLDTRVPKGIKKIVYQFSEHEIFALFGETSKFDGCTERLTLFADEAHQQKLEVRMQHVSLFAVSSAFACMQR